jgi:hypothetical protein
MLQDILEIIYATEMKTKYPMGVYLRAGAPRAVGVGVPEVPVFDAAGYMPIPEVLRRLVAESGGIPITWDDIRASFSVLEYRSVEANIINRLEGEQRRAVVSAMLDISRSDVGLSDDEKARRAAATGGLQPIYAAIAASVGAPRERKEVIEGNIVRHLASDAFLNVVILPYQVDDLPVDIAVASEEDSNYPALEIDDARPLYTNDQVIAFLDAVTAISANAANVDALVAAITPDILRETAEGIRDRAAAGRPVPGASVSTRYVLAPLVASEALRRYARGRRANALAFPAYEGVLDKTLSGMRQRGRFNLGVAFNAKHLKSYFTTPAQAPVAASDAMDIGDDFDAFDDHFGRASSHMGQRIEDVIFGDGESNEFNARVVEIMGSSDSVALRTIRLVLLSLPNTFAVHKSLATMGARLLNIALIRPFETNLVSLVSISTLNGFGTMVNPTQLAAEHHSQVSTMIITMSKEMGTNVLDDKAVSGMCGFTSHRAVAGYNRRIVSGASDLNKHLADRPAVIAVAYPDLDDYMLGDYLHLFNAIPVRYGGDFKIGTNCKHPAALHLDMRFPGLRSLVKAAEAACTDIRVNKGVSGLVARGSVRHYNPRSGGHTHLQKGVSTKGDERLNMPGAEKLMNGGIRTLVSNRSDFTTHRIGSY